MKTRYRERGPQPAAAARKSLRFVRSLLGVIPWYWAGAWLGKDRLRRWVERHGKWLTISVSEFDRSVKWFERYGGVTVFVCRLIPGIRTLISVPAGFAGMPFGRFVLFSALGTFLWAAALAGVGWWLGDQHQQVVSYIKWAAVAVVAAIGIWFSWRWIRQWRQSPRSERAA